jgi:hypothetical protein
MANSDAPRGLNPVRNLSGAPYNGAVRKYYVPSSDSTAIYVGGLVKLVGSADSRGIPTVTGNVASTNIIVGVCIGMADPTRDSLLYRAASTDSYILVADDPGLLFEVQEDSAGGALAASNVGNACALVGYTAGSAITGKSSIEIDSSSAVASGGGALDVVIVALVDREENEIGVNAKWLVRLNLHSYVNANVGV